MVYQRKGGRKYYDYFMSPKNTVEIVSKVCYDYS